MMRKRANSVVYLSAVSVTLLAMAGKCAGDSAGGNDQETTAPAVVVADTTTVEDARPDTVTVADGPQAGDDFGVLIASDGNIAVYADYGSREEGERPADDVYAMDETSLVRTVGGRPDGSMRLIGHHTALTGEGNLCRIIVGVDTVDVDIRQRFRKSLDIRYADALPGCKPHRLSRHHALDPDSPPTDFQINVAMPDSAPLFIRDFISTTIRKHLTPYFDDENSITRIKMRERSVEQMMTHYYNQFCKLYDRKYRPEAGSDGPVYADRYSFQFYAYPVWQNSDSSLTTWKFLHFGYMGGAHGNITEYFVTFDNASGRMLGIADFFDNDGGRKALATLADKLNAYHDKMHPGHQKYEAWLDYPESFDATLNEMRGNRAYPRPAITKQGLVFTYQTYEKGTNADGVLHFTLPFDKGFHLRPASSVTTSTPCDRRD